MGNAEIEFEYEKPDYSAEIASYSASVIHYNSIIRELKTIYNQYVTFSQKMHELKGTNSSLMGSIQDAERLLHEGYESGGEYLDKGQLKACLNSSDFIVSTNISTIQTMITQKMHEYTEKINNAIASRDEAQSKLDYYRALQSGGE